MTDSHAANAAEVKILYPRLTEDNYATWRLNTVAYLGTRGLRSLITAAGAYPPADQTRAEKWHLQAEEAVGVLWEAITQRIRDDDDVATAMADAQPHKMWTAIQDAAQTRNAGSRYAALIEQLDVRMKAEESLTDLYHRISLASEIRKSLRPTNYTLKNLDDELDCFTLIRALPKEYDGLASMLFLGQGLQPFTL
ncbi:hypothetical protein AURDEDRAFT_72182, partial [Auricularia subglabra TFB-10046 SS5]